MKVTEMLKAAVKTLSEDKALRSFAGNGLQELQQAFWPSFESNITGGTNPTFGTTVTMGEVTAENLERQIEPELE
jgi:hypothetical protein